MPDSANGPTNLSVNAAQTPVDEFLSIPVPSSSSGSTPRSTHPLTTVVCDDRAISRLLERILYRGGLSVNEAARQLGVTPNSIRQYIRGRRNKPSLVWFLRLCELCGAKVTIEFPEAR